MQLNFSIRISIQLLHSKLTFENFFQAQAQAEEERALRLQLAKKSKSQCSSILSVRRHYMESFWEFKVFYRGSSAAAAAGKKFPKVLYRIP